MCPGGSCSKAFSRHPLSLYRPLRLNLNVAVITKPRPDAKPPETPAGLGSLDAEKLKLLYATMLKYRMRGTKDGREAILVGCTIDLNGDDCVVIEKTLATNVLDLNVLTGVHSTALKIAKEFKTRNKRKVVLAFDIQPSSESLKVSAAEKLPILFVIEPEARTKIRSLPVITVDKNDVVALYRVSQEAIRRAREGHGPTLIEYAEYRAKKTGPPIDPLDFMENYLKAKNLWSDTWKENLVEQFKQDSNIRF